jgi:uncharacterized protein (TIGR02186 family)
MKPRYARVCLMVLLGVEFWYFGLQACAQSPYLGMEIIEPKQIEMGSFFKGEDIRVKAIFPCDCNLAIRVWGPREDLKLMKKERVAGLWMNVEQVTFDNIPKVYLLWTSRKSSQDGGKSLKELKFDYTSVLAGSLRGNSPGEEQLLIQELVKLKEYDKLYYIEEGTIRTQPLGETSFSQGEAVLHLPAKIYPGSYTLEFIAFKDGKSTLLKSFLLHVQLTGLPAALSHLAAQDGLLYGILAVAVAGLSGLVIGIFFSSRGGH